MSVKAVIYCDKSGTGYQTDHVGKVLLKQWAREDGWTCGKRDLCPKCKKTGGKG